MLSLIAQALAHPVGIRVPALDAEKVRQALMRTIQRLPDPPPPISILTRQTPRGNEVWLVRNEFMNGKKFDHVKAADRLRQATDETGACVSFRGSAGGDHDPLAADESLACGEDGAGPDVSQGERKD